MKLTKCKKAFLESLREFCRYTSISGFRYLVDPKSNRYEKTFWLILGSAVIVFAVLMVARACMDFLENPLITSLESDAYHIKNILFPGVAICNINKISKKRAKDYAEFLFQKRNVSFNYAYDSIKLFTHFYDVISEDVIELLRFQRHLDNISDEPDYIYNVMKDLTTPCEELLHKCYWKMRERNCSEMFSLKITYVGFCCTINYYDEYEIVNDYLSYDKKSPKATFKKLGTTGIENGLSVIIRSDPQDYFYPSIASIGVQVLIFEPGDYPDMYSGNLIEELVTVGKNVHLNLNAKSFYSTKEVQKYSERTCVFRNEFDNAFGTYSGSNCLVECRLRSVLALCKCVPFTFPNVSENICGIADVPCLNKHAEKWSSLDPHLDDFDDFENQLQTESENGLWCYDCFSNCDSTFYTINTVVIPTNKKTELIEKNESFSTLRIYYGNKYTKLYKQDAAFYWYEMLSNVGGLLGLFIGSSIMSAIEIIYFITVRFIKIYCTLQ